jgi:hypothetical protein
LFLSPPTGARTAISLSGAIEEAAVEFRAVCRGEVSAGLVGADGCRAAHESVVNRDDDLVDRHFTITVQITRALLRTTALSGATQRQKEKQQE